LICFSASNASERVEKFSDQTPRSGLRLTVIAFDDTILMLPDAMFQIFGVASVETVIRTFQDIDEEGHEDFLT